MTSCCNAASSPGASRKRVPPSLDVPSGEYPRQHYTRSNKCPPAADPAPARFMARYHSHSPPATCHRPDGRRFPPTHGSAPLHRRPPRRHPHHKRCSAPRLRHRAPPASNSFFFSRQSFTLHQHRRASHHASSPPRVPVSMREEWRFVESGDVVGVFPSRCRLRALWRQAFPRHSRRFRTPKVVCAAWSFLRERLTPRPTTAKSHYRLLWSANFVRPQEEQLVSS